MFHFVLVFIGSLLTLAIGFFYYLILIGDLGFIFPRNLLKRLHVPKCLYR